jgi:Cu2+-containing amine oxidase
MTCIGVALMLNFVLFYFFWQIREARPKVTLVVRMVASVANYDYIVDWEFQTDGLIRAKVSDKLV